MYSCRVTDSFHSQCEHSLRPTFSHSVFVCFPSLPSFSLTGCCVCRSDDPLSDTSITAAAPSLLCCDVDRELKGVVVSLSADGHLLCSYMGTDPSFFSTPKVDAREADYQQVEAEMKRLQKFIREASRTQGWSRHLHQEL